MDDKDRILEEELAKAADMKVSDLKMKLMAMGVLTHGFVEKSDFVKAYAEAVAQKGNNSLVAMSEGALRESGDHDLNAAMAAAGIDDEDDDEDFLENLPPVVKARVDQLKELNEEREKEMEKYLVERAALEAKYQNIFRPLYSKRAEIVAGASNSGQEEVMDETETEAIKGIPEFWVSALAKMGPVAQMIEPDDLECLSFLEDIVCDDHEDGTGFTLRFRFTENEFFENSELVKKYEIPNLLLADEPIIQNVEGTEIQWKEGKSLTFKKVTKQQRGKGKNSGQIRTIQKEERVDSFFHFFASPKMPSLSTLDEEQAQALEQLFDEDYTVAQAFRSHIIPKAVLWFTGEAMEMEMEAALKHMNHPDLMADASSDGENPECKQQ